VLAICVRIPPFISCLLRYFTRFMFRTLLIVSVLSLTTTATQAQIQVDLKFSRLQYIAYEPVLAKVTITNLAGHDIDLYDEGGQSWCGFEIKGDHDRLIAPHRHPQEPPLHLAAGTSVTRKIDLTGLFAISDLGVYHVRANVFFADLNKFFYARTKVFEITSARPIWQQTVGDPKTTGTRTYSLMTNRFPDHTSLYVRVEDRQNSLVCATYSLGRVIAFDEPHAQLDHENRLHVLQCSAPRVWSYSVIGLDGRLLQRATYSQGRSLPRLRLTEGGNVTVHGGMLQSPAAPAAGRTAPSRSAHPANVPPED
jgi:hypothetical protein